MLTCIVIFVHVPKVICTSILYKLQIILYIFSLLQKLLALNTPPSTVLRTIMVHKETAWINWVELYEQFYYTYSQEYVKINSHCKKKLNLYTFNPQ